MINHVEPWNIVFSHDYAIKHLDEQLPLVLLEVFMTDKNSRASVAYYSFSDTDTAWKFCRDHLEDWRSHCLSVAGKFKTIVTESPLFKCDDERLLESMVAEYEPVRCSFKDERFDHKERVIFEAVLVCMFQPHC